MLYIGKYRTEVGELELIDREETELVPGKQRPKSEIAERPGREQAGIGRWEAAETEIRDHGTIAEGQTGRSTEETEKDRERPRSDWKKTSRTETAKRHWKPTLLLHKNGAVSFCDTFSPPSHPGTVFILIGVSRVIKDDSQLYGACEEWTATIFKILKCP
jgi:hypothetical protein